MRLGLSVNSTYVVSDPREGARRMVERVRVAHAANLDSLFVGDHHNVSVPYMQNSPILGRLLAEWPDRVAGALYLLPLWHPVLLAEQIGTLAAVHSGPFVIQCAIGGGEDQFGAFGASLRTRPSRFEWTLDIVRRLLDGETVNAAEPLNIGNARIAPGPREGVDVWIGAAAPAAIDRAARLADGFIAGPECTPERAREVLATYREACERNDRPVGHAVLRRDVHVGASDADAAGVADPVIAAGYRGFDPSATVFGATDTVIDSLSTYATMGYDEILVRHLSSDQDQVLASFERLADVHAALAAL